MHVLFAHLGSFNSTAVAFGSHTSVASLSGDKKNRDEDACWQNVYHLLDLYSRRYVENLL